MWVVKRILRKDITCHSSCPLPISHRVRWMHEHYSKEGEGFLLIFSLTCRSSFEEIAWFHNKILKFRPNPVETPIVLVGNKCDLTVERRVAPEGKPLTYGFVLTRVEADVTIFRGIEARR